MLSNNNKNQLYLKTNPLLRWVFHENEKENPKYIDPYHSDNAGFCGVGEKSS